MKLLRWIITVTLIVLTAQEHLAQLSPMRTGLSLGGAAKSTTDKNQRFTLLQSIGQSGVIGVVDTNGLLLRQGFIQPDFAEDRTQYVKLKATVYPNPFSEDLTLYLEEGTKELSILILDMMGRPVHASLHHSEPKIVLNLPTLTSGVYIIRAQSATRHFTTLILKE